MLVIRVSMIMLCLVGSWYPHAVGANIIQLEMNKVPRNSEMNALVTNYYRQQQTATNEDQSPHIFTTPHDRDVPSTGDDHEILAANSAQAVETRIHSGEGSHTIQVRVGGQRRDLIIDTGSGKTAFICAGCISCGAHHLNRPFSLTKATEFLHCDAQADPSAHDCLACINGKCRYGQTYVEGDYWVAYKASDEMSFSDENLDFKTRVEFGCIYEQTGVFNEQSSDGIMGFSRHKDSIFEQLYHQKLTKTRLFSQCLAADGGFLTLGGVDLAVNTSPIMYTPLRETGYQYWTVSLLSVAIGDTPVNAAANVYNKGRGCVFDSGTTFLYLPAGVRSAFISAWKQTTATFINEFGDGDEKFFLPENNRFYELSQSQVASFPKICFTFANNAQLCMPPTLYFVEIASGQYAGTIMFSDQPQSTIIGASVLMNHNIIYDVDNSRIGMATADCDRHNGTSSGQRVELSTNPGGDKFSSAINYNTATQWMLTAITLLAVVGLVKAIWLEAFDLQAQKEMEEWEENPKKEEHTSLAGHDNLHEEEFFACYFLHEDDQQ